MVLLPLHEQYYLLICTLSQVGLSWCVCLELFVLRSGLPGSYWCCLALGHWIPTITLLGLKYKQQQHPHKGACLPYLLERQHQPEAYVDCRALTEVLGQQNTYPTVLIFLASAEARHTCMLHISFDAPI